MLTVRERVGKLFSQLSFTKTEKLTSVFSPYRQLLEQLADGQEVDVDAAEIVLEETKKTRDQLERDVETLLQRRRWAKQLSESNGAEREMARLSDEHSAISKELDRINARMQTELQKKWFEIRKLEDFIMSAVNAKHQLQENILDPGVAARLKTIDAFLESSLEKLRPLNLEMSTLRLKSEPLRRNVDGATRSLTARRSVSDPQSMSVRQAEADLAREESALENHLEEIERLQKAIDELTVENEPFIRERDAILNECLKP